MDGLRLIFDFLYVDQSPHVPNELYFAGHRSRVRFDNAEVLLHMPVSVWGSTSRCIFGFLMANDDRS